LCKVNKTSSIVFVLHPIPLNYSRNQDETLAVDRRMEGMNVMMIRKNAVEGVREKAAVVRVVV